jgi:Co/Zn/Cd efflux system component
MSMLLAKSRGGLARAICARSDARWLALFTALVGAFGAFEFVFALRVNSLMMLTDSFHQGFDCVAFGCSLWALVGARRPPNATHTFGFSRHEVLATFANATLLIFICAFLAVEAVHRLCSGEMEVRSSKLIGVGAAGLALNSVGVVAFYRYVRSFRLRHLPNAGDASAPRVKESLSGGASGGASGGGGAKAPPPRLYDVEAATNPHAPQKTFGLPGNPLLDLHKDMSEILGGNSGDVFPWREVLRAARDGTRGAARSACRGVIGCIGRTSGAGRLLLQITSGADFEGARSELFSFWSELFSSAVRGRSLSHRRRPGSRGGRRHTRPAESHQAALPLSPARRARTDEERWRRGAASPARTARRGGERVVWQHIAAGSASSLGVLIGGYLVQQWAMCVVAALSLFCLLARRRAAPPLDSRASRFLLLCSVTFYANLAHSLTRSP